MSVPSFVLASASPARRRLLAGAGILARVQPSDFDEATISITDPDALVQALALGKAETVVRQCQDDSLVLGCDSVLAIHGEIHGKPANVPEAIARWRQMRGNQGDLWTGHALIDTQTSRRLVHARLTRVCFAEVSDAEIEAYVATGEPLQCAGCFALEGRGGLFVAGIESCHTNVIGLSLPLLRQMLNQLGYRVSDFWRPELNS
jgi:septum formation protein